MTTHRSHLVKALVEKKIEEKKMPRHPSCNLLEFNILNLECPCIVFECMNEITIIYDRIK